METEFSSFFKYCSDNEKVINGIFRDNKIRFTQPAALNDPLEFNPTLKFSNPEYAHQLFELDGIKFPSLEQVYRVQIIESQINAFGILSLTKKPFSFDMWARYANGHKGFVLELKSDFYKHPCMKSRDGLEYPVREVEYDDEYILEIEKFVDETGTISLNVLQDEFFFKKTSRWVDENEYRMIRPFIDLPGYGPKENRTHRDDEIYPFEFSLDCVSSVIFGAYMSNDKKKQIVDACQHYSIEFYQAFIIRDQKDEFDKPSRILSIPIVKLVESIDELFERGIHSFITDTDNINRQKTLKIREPDELPYDPDYVDNIIEYYKNRTSNKKMHKGKA